MLLFKPNHPKAETLLVEAVSFCLKTKGEVAK